MLQPEHPKVESETGFRCGVPGSNGWEQSVTYIEAITLLPAHKVLSESVELAAWLKGLLVSAFNFIVLEYLARRVWQAFSLSSSSSSASAFWGKVSHWELTGALWTVNAKELSLICTPARGLQRHATTLCNRSCAYMASTWQTEPSPSPWALIVYESLFNLLF